MSNRCLNCYFGDKCKSSYDCDDYTPINPEEDTDLIIEHGRQEFLSDWFQYVDEYAD